MRVNNELYNLYYTQVARDDMLEILLYISDELNTPQSAERILQKIDSDLGRLRSNPYSAPISRDEYLSSQGFRILVSGKYLALYKVNENDRLVTVYRIVYGRRNLDWLIP